MSYRVTYAVSVYCGKSLGWYQGLVLEVGGTTVTMTKVFRNGFLYSKPQVTLNVADIKKLTILEACTQQPVPLSTVEVTQKPKQGARAAFCDTLLVNPSSSGSYGNSGNTPKGRNAAGKFHHDENVLGDAAGEHLALYVPYGLRGEVDYVTDDGVHVPSMAAVPRRHLWASLRRIAPVPQMFALLARAAADVTLRIVGGVERLAPHQAPYAVVLCGAHGVGLAGVVTARLLATHGARWWRWSRHAPAGMAWRRVPRCRRFCPLRWIRR